MGNIKVAVVGATGKMGSEVVRAVAAEADLTLVGAVGRTHVGEDIGEFAGLKELGVEIQDSLTAMLESKKPDVVVDFTFPGIVYENSRTILEHNAYAVVGTTGLMPDQLKELGDLASEKGKAILVAPNFALGAILMMKFSQMAAKFLENVEIIEYHHNGKLDSPSGTALKTAEMIAAVKDKLPQDDRKFYEKLPHARGGEMGDIHIHSVRLPGMVAHQEVIFGGKGQYVTIRHDSLNRESFMPGVIMAVRRIPQENGLIYGLDEIMDFEN